MVLQRNVAQVVPFLAGKSGFGKEFLHDGKHLGQKTRQAIHDDARLVEGIFHFGKSPHAVKRLADVGGGTSGGAFNEHFNGKMRRAGLGLRPATRLEHTFQPHNGLVADIDNVQRQAVVERERFGRGETYAINDPKGGSDGAV